MADETAAVTTTTDDSQQLSDTAGLTDIIGADLKATGVPVKDSPAVNKSPEVAEQDEKTETTEEVQETAQTAESESQTEEVAEDKTETQETQDLPLPKKLRGVIKDQREQLKQKDAELAALRQSSTEKLQSFQLPEPEIPKEQTKAHWQTVYQQLTSQGVSPDDPRCVEAVANYNKADKLEFYREVTAAQRKQEQSRQYLASYNEAMIELHQTSPFLVPTSGNVFGYELNPESPVTKEIHAMALAEGRKLDNPEVVKAYAQRAVLRVVRQQLGYERQTVDTLKRKTAEAEVKGAVTSGKRPAPPQPKNQDQRIDSLAKVAAQSGRKQDRLALANAAIGADLGI